jgi:cell division protein FtsL
MSDKHELLDGIDVVLNPKKKVDGTRFIYTFLIIMFALAMIFPKIYIQQQIYFKSRDIAKLKGEYDTLKEENKQISADVESIRFKNQVLDTLF